MTARNPSTETENRIHSDDVARRYGFLGGLVPGVTVYAYATHAMLGALGREWVTGGWARMRFLHPCFDGEELAVRVRTAGEGGAIDVEAWVERHQCVAGHAALGAAPDLATGEIPWADHPQPDERAGRRRRVRPGPRARFDPVPDRRRDRRRLPGHHRRAVRRALREGWVHPGMLLQGANRILVANVVMPAWVHVESTIQHRRAVRIGEPLEVRARVADAFERKGHRFVALDVVWASGAASPAPEVLADARHVAIWQLAG